ncbi:hypothetical protein Fmac_023602 [Flemingia macrophylla]|uniref:Uncharacterized protein n=1 Tax=Flemingia macrophylla TaxID=520843 RepID=A0ABD1LM01_9FABA
MAKEAGCELERLRAEGEEDRIPYIKERAAIEIQRDVFSRLRHEVVDQLQNLVGNKGEIAYEKERISKLRELAEVGNKEITRLQYELEIERKALSMARAWAEDETKRVRENAVALERARDRWERNEIKVRQDSAEKQYTVDRADNLLEKLKEMATDVGGRSGDMIHKIILIISHMVSRLREWACKTRKQAEILREAAICRGVEKRAQKFKT